MPDGACPECGHPITPSLNPSRLVFADPRWVRRVSRGMSVLYVTIPAAAIAVFAVGIVLWPYFWSGRGVGFVAGQFAIATMRVVAGVVVAAASLRMAAREPGRHTDAKADAWRRLTQVAGIAWALTLLMRFAWPAVYVPSAGGCRLVLGTLAFALLCGMVTGLLGLLRRLATRLPDDRLARRAGRSAIALVVAGAVILLLSLARQPTEELADAFRLIANVLVLGGVWDYLRRFRHAQRRLAPPPRGRPAPAHRPLQP